MAAAPTLSLCMIVKDEEAQLPRCLASVAGVVDEIVVVDTGSSDRTVAIATEFGAKLLYHTWDGSFSSARNVSLDGATGDWILILDADEALAEDAGPLLRAAVAEVDPDLEAMTLPIVNFVGERAHEEAVTAPSVRVFRNRPEYRYTRALHEQIMFAILESRPEARMCYIEARIEHYGYLNAIVADRDKIQRNLKIAEQEVERYPEDAFAWYNYGQEYFRLAEWQKAIDAYQTGYRFLESLAAGFAPALVKHLVVSLLNLSRSRDAIAVLHDAQEAYPEFTDLWVLEGLALMQQKDFPAAAARFLTASEKGEVASSFYMSDEGVGSYKAMTWLATCYLNMGRLHEARQAYHEALTEIARRGRYLPQAVDGLLQVHRLLKVPEAELLASMTSVIDVTDRRWRELLAERLLSAGIRPPAFALLAGLDDLRPSTRLQLGMARLKTGDLDAALAEWSAIDPATPERLFADGHLLLAHALGGDLDAAQRVLDEDLSRYGEGEMVGFYRALLQLWRGLDPGQVAPPELTTGRAALRSHLVELLGLLLECEAYDLFGACLPAFDWLGVTEPEQAGLLGRLYNQAGLADMALEALVLAVQAGQDDEETLRLLGLLCLRLGKYQEAETILREVLRRQEAEGVSWVLNNTALVGYATVLTALGRESEAAPLWQKLMQSEQPIDPSP